MNITVPLPHVLSSTETRHGAFCCTVKSTQPLWVSVALSPIPPSCLTRVQPNSLRCPLTLPPECFCPCSYLYQVGTVTPFSVRPSLSTLFKLQMLISRTLCPLHIFCLLSVFLQKIVNSMRPVILLCCSHYWASYAYKSAWKWQHVTIDIDDIDHI